MKAKRRVPADKKKLEWHKDGTFSFSKSSRPTWISVVKKMKIAAGQDRRHGLHGEIVITQACETFINNELKKRGKEKTYKKLCRNLGSRINAIKKNIKATTNLEKLINTFRKYAFGKVENLLPGDGQYNKAIEAVRKRLTGTRNKMHKKFFSQGELPNEIKLSNYKKYVLAILQIKKVAPKGSIKEIVNDIITSVVQPAIKQSSTILAIDEIITNIIGTTTLDVAFEKTKIGRKYNKRVLLLDTKIKRAITNEEGLTRWVFNNLIGRPIPRKKATKTR